MLKSCPSCKSDNQRAFSAEVNVHFPGIEGLTIPTLWLFPTILVCMDCGTSRFTIADAERKELDARDYRDFVDGAAV